MRVLTAGRLLTVLFFCLSYSVFAQRFWVASGPSNWNNTANWSTTSGGAGGASVPGAADVVTFNALGAGNCTLDIAPTVAGITMNGYTGTVNINGFTLTTTGNNTFTSGTINNSGAAGSLALNTTGSSTFNGTTFGANLTGTSGRLIFSGSTFNGSVSVTKTDANNDVGSGGNIFNSTTTITNQGDGFLLFGNTNRDQFNGLTTFNDNGGYRIYFAHNHGGQTTTFGSSLTLNATKSGGTDPWSFLIGEGANTSFTVAGNFTINVAGAIRGDIRFLSGGGTATFNGDVIVNHTNSDPSTSVNLNTSGTVTYNGNIILTHTGGGNGIFFNTGGASSATMAAGKTISIGGGYNAGQLVIQRFTQNGTQPMSLTATGTAFLRIGPNAVFGGNIDFRSPRIQLGSTTANGTAYVEKTGAGNDDSAGGNTFASNVTFVNSGSGYLRSNGGNVFNGPVSITNSSNSDVLLELNTGSVYNSSLTIFNTGTSSVRVGYIGTNFFNDNIVVNSTGGTGVLFSENAAGSSTLASGKTISVGGAGFTSGTLLLNSFIQLGTTAQSLTGFIGTTTVTVTSGSIFNGNLFIRAPQVFVNGSTFNGTSSFEKTGATDNYSSGGNTFQGNVTFTNTGTGEFNMGNGSSDTFNGDVTVNNTGSYRLRLAYSHPGQTTSVAGNLVVNTAKTGGTDQWSFLAADGTNTTLNVAGNVTLNCSGTIRSDHRFGQGTGSSVIIGGDFTINNTNTDPSTTFTMVVNGTGTYGGNIRLTNTGGGGFVTFDTGATSSSTQAAGKGISIVGGFTGGGLTIARFTQAGALPTSLVTTGATTFVRVGPATTIGGDLVLRSSRLFLDGVTVNGTSTIEKTGASDDNSGGGNVFNGVTNVTNSGSGYLLFGNGNADTFNGATTFNDIGSYRIYFAHNHPGQTTTFASDLTLNANKSGGTDAWSYLIGEVGTSAINVGGSFTINNAGTLQSNIRMFLGSGSSATYNGPVTVNVTNSNAGTSISLGETGTSTYNGNIQVINSGGAAGVTFNLNATASSTLNGTISVGTFSSGSLNLYRFTQVGAVPENITLTGSSIFRIGPASSFDGPVTFIAPRIFLNGATYNGTAYLEKNGASSDDGAGGNVFNGVATIVNSSTGYLLTANTAPDIFNANLVIRNTGTNWMYLAHNVAGNQFNGNVELNNTGSANGVIFSNNATGSSTLGNGTLTIGASGFSTGELRIRRMTQVGSTPITLSLSGASTILRVGPNDVFGGNLDFRAPRVFLDGMTSNGTAYIEKNGVGNDDGNGGNTFNGATTIATTSSGYLLTANAQPDIFNGDLNAVNTGSNWIFLAHNVAGNQFNGNITVSNSGSGLGIIFSNNASGFSTFAGTSINVGAGGFSTGQLRFRRFTQTSSSPLGFTLTGSAQLLLGPSSLFTGNVTFITPQLFLHGATYNGITYLEKSGSGGNAGDGGNIFNQATTIVNSGNATLSTANVTPDIFNADLIITNSGSSTVQMSENSAGNQFNGNIQLNSTSGGGIYFGNNTAGTSTLAATKTIAVGTSGVISGDIRLIRFTQVGPTAQALDLSGIATLTLGPSSRFGGDVNFKAPRLLLNGTIYDGLANLEKTGANGDTGVGGNTFNGVTSIVNSGTGNLLLGNTSPDIFNGDLTVSNTGSAQIQMSENSPGNQINGNLILNSNFGGGIVFGNNTLGTTTLAATKTVSVGGLGATTGNIRFFRFTQVGATAQSLTFTGAATLTVGPATTFGGNVDFKSPRVFLNGATYSGTASIEKTGANNDAGNGGNVFNGTTTLTDSGSGYLMTGNTAADTFNGALTVTNTGSNIIYLAYNTPGNQFNGNITFNSTLGSGGVYIGDLGPATATFANGTSLQVGGLGFSSGELRLKRLTQVGSAPQTLLLTGTALLRIGPSTTFNGVLDFRSPQIALDGATYNGVSYLEKTGATSNTSNGGNTFNGTTTIVNSGSGSWRFGVSTLDAFNGDLILTNTGASQIQMADVAAGTTFNGNIQVNSTFGGGVYFGENGGTASLATGKTISVGSTGFSLGDLRIRRFTQTGSTAQTLALSGTATLVLGPTATWNGNCDFRAPQLLINGGTFNAAALLEKNGATGNTGSGNTTFNGTTTIQITGSGFLRTQGGNTFNGTTTLLNSGTSDLLLELSVANAYNGDLTITNTGSSYVRMTYIGNTTFSGNILVNSTGGQGIWFSENTGTATLAAGKTMSVGATGFSGGELRLQRFTQVGATAQTLTMTGSSTFRSGPTAVWNGNLTVSSPTVFLDGTTLNGTTNSVTKTGTSSDASVGGNTFGGSTTFSNTGTGVFRFANTTADDFVGNVTFNQAAGSLQPAYNVASTFRGNVAVDGSTTVSFGANNGGVIFTGTAAQQVNRLGSASPDFRRLTMNKASGAVTMNTASTVSVSATFTSGVINTTATNLLNFADNATTSGASNASHIDGPVRKTGNDIFTFPTGDNGIYRGIGISAPTNTAHFFTAELFRAAQAFGGVSTYGPGIVTLTPCEYWILDRSPGGSNVSVTISWVTADCTGPYISNPATLLVARWNGTNWVSHGNGGTTGTAAAGTVTSAGVITSFSPIALGSSTLSNPLPVELVKFEAQPSDEMVRLNWLTASEHNNDFFEVERSIDGAEFKAIKKVKGAGTKEGESQYEAWDEQPIDGLSYYRLRQVDFDGKTTFSKLVMVRINLESEFSMWPNPASAGELVHLSKKGPYSLLNSLGIKLHEGDNIEQLDTSGLTPGVYLVRYQSGVIKRLVVK